MTPKRKVSNNLNVKNKIVRTDIVSLDKNSEIKDIAKANVIQEMEKLKEVLSEALRRKDRQYAELKREKDNLELKKYVVEAMNENLGKEMIELKQKLKQQQEERVEENKVVENLVDTLKGRVENHDAEVQKLVNEVTSLERNETFLKNSLDSMDKILVKK